MGLHPTPILRHRPFRGIERLQRSIAGLDYPDVIVLEVEGPVTEAALRRAAHALAVRHPVLRTHVGAVHAGLTVLTEPPAPLPVRVRTTTMTEGMEEVLNGAATGPWRLVGIPGERCWHLLLAVHHALVDGRSLSLLAADLLVALADPTALGEPLPPPTALLERVPAPAWTGIAAPLLRHAWATALRHRRLLDAAPLPGPGPIPTFFAAERLERGRVAALAASARRAEATVGGALAAAAWDATARLVARRHPGAPIAIEAMVDALGEPDRTEPGMYASGVLALSGWNVPSDPWTRARKAARQTRRQIRLGVPLLAHVLADGVDDPAAWLRGQGVDLARNGGAGALAQVSNVGAWRTPHEVGALRLRGAWSATRAVRAGPALLVWLRTVDGIGCLSAIGNAAVVTRQELESWLGQLRDALVQLGARCE